MLLLRRATRQQTTKVTPRVMMTVRSQNNNTLISKERATEEVQHIEKTAQSAKVDVGQREGESLSGFD